MIFKTLRIEKLEADLAEAKAEAGKWQMKAETMESAFDNRELVIEAIRKECDEAKAEAERLNRLVNMGTPALFEDGKRKELAEVVSNRDALAAQAQALREALERIPVPSGGRHHEGCTYVTGDSNCHECSCGWNDYCNEVRELKRQALSKTTP